MWGVSHGTEALRGPGIRSAVSQVAMAPAARPLLLAITRTMFSFVPVAAARGREASVLPRFTAVFPKGWEVWVWKDLFVK